MISELQGMFDAINDPQFRHAAIVHFPVALSSLALLVMIIAMVLGRKGRTLMYVAIGAYALLVVSAFLAVRSGEDAEAAFTSPDPVAQALLADHESMADRVWIFAAGVGVLLIVSSFIRKKAVKVGGAVVALSIGVATVGWVGVTAHKGGMLVYDHAVGVTIPEPEPVEEVAIAELSPEERFFVETIHPILTENCTRCHNPKRQRRSGDLDLTTQEGLMTGGFSGVAVVPGVPEASLLLTVIKWEEEDFEMPPDTDQLPEESIAAVEQWILDGAVWVE